MRPSIASLGRQVYHRRHAVIIIWLMIFVAAIFFAPRLPGATTGGGFETPGSESAAAADILQDEFGLGYRSIVQVVFHDPAGDVDDPGYRERVLGAVARLEAIEGVAGVTTYYGTGLDELVSPDRDATYAIVKFSLSEGEIKRLVPELREGVGTDDRVRAHVIGGPAFDHDLEETSKSDLWEAERYALPAILIILIIVFGSLVAAGLPALLGGASVTLALALLYFLGLQVGLSIFVLNMVTMVGMGLGVDYSLFIVSRYREELARSGSPREAVSTTVATAGRAVFFSGAAVIVGMAMLVPFNFVFMRSLGIGGMVVAAISVLVAITLLPAVLGVLRHRIDWGRLLPARHPGAETGRFWVIWSRMVMRHPVFFLVVSVAFLLALSLPVVTMKSGSPTGEDIREEADSRQGLELFVTKWGVGEASPIYIVIDTGKEGGAWSRELRGGLEEMADRLEGEPRIERIHSLLTVDAPAGAEALRDYLLANPVAASRMATMANIAGDGDVGLVRVVTREGPSRQSTKELVEELRTGIIPGISSLQGSEVLVGGSAAESVDFSGTLKRSFPYLLVAVLSVTYIVLLLLFRSVVLPLKAIFMNLLSVAAAYGVLVLVFQHGFGSRLLDFTPAEGIIPFVPVILFAILFGLSMDYEVFLLSRIKEEYDRGVDNDEAVTLGLQRTGRIITTAALIMIAVFASFTLAESIIIKEFGVGLAVAIALDASIVRIVVVPATMKLMGRWNWWMPAWLDRILPDLSLRERAGDAPGETR